METYKNLNESRAFQALSALGASDLRQLLTAQRVREAEVAMAAGLRYNFAAKPVDDRHLDFLQQLVGEMDLIGQYRQLLAGAVMNGGENRLVLHQLSRGQLAGPVCFQGRDLGAFYLEQRQRINAFARAVHAGEICSSVGKPFRHVCQIGIGGSDLGPRALYLALTWLTTVQATQPMTASFISNVDPDDAAQVLAGCDLGSTLFILVSKSGTTQETLANEQLVRHVLQQRGLDPARQMVAVTSETSPLACSVDYLDSFYIDDFIGGRFSSTSAVGVTLLTLAFGEETVRSFLAGAHEQDQLALDPNIRSNASLLDALLGLYERNVLGFGATAILPYSQALSRFPAHLQQLDMESNGKSVNRRGEVLPYSTGPLIFGEPGTNGQHSFYQLLHQGTDPVPLQFIGFRHCQGGTDFPVDGSTSQQKLNANLVAQIVAFAAGRDADDANKRFPGQRPASLIYGQQLTPAALGALLAHYENKVMFQGFAWNINSFDQEGVQLGKKLAHQILTGQSENDALQAMAALLEVESTGS
ncbi:MAG: glucose-6-phosphate isomerase [Desulfuromonadaceae bacterium]|nr:glucose-6-phosphate isomerase [Desulfuromonadaceae bacterium]